MNDAYYMKMALDLAMAGLGQTSPNPLVGAVVVKEGEVVGLGAHLKAGEPHAEVHAIRMAGEKAYGATIYVTLEPCSHYGKTPPCVDLIIERGIKRVVIAATDLNPLVSGSGIKKLQEVGIEVEVGILQDESIHLNKTFFHYITHQTPFVTLKYASSLDGKIATKSGDSKWITSNESREDVHKIRAMHDAILVGVNTVIMDDPSLTVRVPMVRKNPIRIILDTNLRTSTDANVVSDGMADTWIVVGNHVPNNKIQHFNIENVKIIQMDTPSINIKELLKTLGSMKITSLFVEGGSQVHDSFVRAGAVNQIIAYIAPKIIGGDRAPSPVGGLGFQDINESLQLKIDKVETIGPDIKITAIPK